MGSGSGDPTWFRTDEKVEALAALKEFKKHLEIIKSGSDLNSWRWSLLSLHSALQGFMVWAIRRGHDLDVISNKVYRKDPVESIIGNFLLWLDRHWCRFLDRVLKRKKYTQIYREWITGNRDPKHVPTDLLCSFEELYEKIKNKRLMEDSWASGKKFQPEGTQGRSIKGLNYWRNRFIHFFPWALSLDVGLLPPIFEDCIHTIEFLALESGHIHFATENEESEFRSLLEGIKQKLPKLHLT